jgi:hypothetical protein
MSKYAKHRGHIIEEKEKDKWYYSDTNQLVSNNINRDCGFCGKPQTEERHDPCIGTLSNVMNACCGHGDIKESYVQFLNGSIIRGAEAKKYIKKHKKQ